jgi:hypothetical protein
MAVFGGKWRFFGGPLAVGGRSVAVEKTLNLLC